MANTHVAIESKTLSFPVRCTANARTWTWAIAWLSAVLTHI